MPEQKKEEKRKEEVKVKTSGEYNAPRFSNYVNISYDSEHDAASFTFFWIEKAARDENDNIPGFALGKIAMTKKHMKRFHKALGDVLEAKQEKK
ncbi:hypothetical protein GF354_05455 [Candidatus Peregrinibacteria bacterium]|nr:hypothetical protein [Candidatus Peregrinibacteria bacterium]